MAKAKSGGTRALLRGRVASDVYSVGRDGSGRRQQVVRSLPETVSNPRTLSQVDQRIKMKTITRMLSLLRPIVDHSWEGVQYGQQSISEFIKRSFSLINQWIDRGHNPDTYLFLGENESGVAAGLYPLSEGSLSVPENVYNIPNDSFANVPSWVNANDTIANYYIYGILVGLSNKPVPEGGSVTYTLGEVRSALGLAEGDYMTYCVLGKDIDGRMAFFFSRFYFKGGASDDTVVTNDNISTFFEVEGNLTPEVYIVFDEDNGVNRSAIYLGFEDTNLQLDWKNSGVNVSAMIVSRKLANGWGRSTSFLQIGKLTQNASPNELGDFYKENAGSLWDDVHEEWTIGASRFLNGGSLTD